jgi:hypothetical protein
MVTVLAECGLIGGGQGVHLLHLLPLIRCFKLLFSLRVNTEDLLLITNAAQEIVGATEEQLASHTDLSAETTRPLGRFSYRSYG